LLVAELIQSEQLPSIKPVFILPTVIRELDSMKQREGLFRWIEECMATESWWIHDQRVFLNFV
jgi:hypothetical protein